VDKPGYKLDVTKSSVYNANGSVKKIDQDTKIFKCLRCRNHHYFRDHYVGGVCVKCHEERTGVGRTKDASSDQDQADPTCPGVSMDSDSTSGVNVVSEPICNPEVTRMREGDCGDEMPDEKI